MKSSLYPIFLIIAVFMGCGDKDTITQPPSSMFGSIKGVVIDKDSNSIARGIGILTIPPTTNSISDDSGRYIINSVPSGSYKIHPVKVNYIADTLNISVVENQTTIANLFLSQVNPYAPKAPLLSEPTDSATDIPLIPTLTWFVNTSAEAYQLQVSLNKTFSTLLINQSGIVVTQYPITGLIKLQTYYWRVRATNSHGNSPWSATYSFTTTLGAVPPTPALNYPSAGATNISPHLTLNWLKSSGAVSYTLQVSDTISFKRIQLEEKDLRDTLYEMDNLDSSTTYYWRLSAKNSFGTTPYSTRNFTTAGGFPSKPVLLTPIDNDTSISILPTLSWSSSSLANYYTLQLSRDSLFNSLVYTQNYIYNTSYTSSKLLNYTKYFWRVKSVNAIGSSDWSSTFHFSTIGAIPTVPILSSPFDNSINVAAKPNFTWNAVNFATSYRLQISKTSDFLNTVIDETGIPNSSYSESTLNFSTNYFWRVAAINYYGMSPWSTSRSFLTIAGPCPGIPTVIHDNKIYNTVQIGNQCWFKENLNIGVMIQVGVNSTNNSIIEKYCYANNTDKCNTYGGLYQWDEAMNYNQTSKQGLCPQGWHIPTYSDLQICSTFVSGNAKALKSVGQGTGNGTGTNTSGFSAILTGYRYYTGYFEYEGGYSAIWSSLAEQTQYAYYLHLDSNTNNIQFPINDKNYGYSIRCIKDF